MSGQFLTASPLVPVGAVLTWLVQSTVLLATGLLAGRLLRKRGPAVQSALYRTTLGAVVLCPIASLVMAALGFSGLLVPMPAPSDQQGAIVANPPFAPELEPSIGRDRPNLEPGDLPGAHARHTVVVPALADVAPEPARAGGAGPPIAINAKRSAQAHGSPRWPDLIGWASALVMAAWLFGAALLGTRLWVGHRRMARLRSSAIDAEPGVTTLCRDLAARMRLQAPAVLRSPFLCSPCLDGVRWPAILLPEDAEEHLRETFIHELAHLRRRDGFWNLVRHGATAVFWLQPLLWLLSKRLEATAEEVCDDYVVEFGADRSRYAGHLIELAERRLPPLAPAGVGMISLRSLLARRITRILDSTRTLSTKAGRRAVAATLFAGLAGTLLVGLLGVRGAEQKPDAPNAPTGQNAGTQLPQKTAEGKARPEPKPTRGQVVGPDGKPVAGATVIAARWRRILDGISDQSSWNLRFQIARATTGLDGRFEVRFGPSDEFPVHPGADAANEVLATAAGFGVGYGQEDHVIRLTAGDLPINGRLVDLEGRPVAGVTVRLGQIAVPLPEKNAKADPEEKPGSIAGRLLLDADPLLPDGVTTGPDGRFQIERLGRDVLAHLTLTGPTIARKGVKVLTRSMGPVAGDQRDPALRALDDPATYGADCTIVVEATRPIEGIVRDADTNEPIKGAIVMAAELSGSTMSLDGSISARTDARGHYRLVGLPKEQATGHKLSVYPPLDQPYFITRRIQARARPGFEPLECHIALKRGIWITGKAIDLASGKPVRAAIEYIPLLTNAHARDYPNFDPKIATSIAIETRYQTDGEGRFRIPGLPGGGVVTAHTEDRSYRVGVGAEAIKGRTDQNQLLTYHHITPELYQSLKEVNIPEGTESAACVLALDAGRSIGLRLVDAAGAPVKDCTVQGRVPYLQDEGDMGLYGESTVRISGLVPGKPRTVLIQNNDRKIGALLSVAADGLKDGAELTVTLRPYATVTGRLLLADGKPASGGVLIGNFPPTDGLPMLITVDEVKLDALGRFRCDNVPAGGPYRVSASDGLESGSGTRSEAETFEQFDLTTDLKVEPRQMIDLGAYSAATGQRVKELAKPPAEENQRGKAEPPARTMPVIGRIVDLEGRPVAGALVQVTQITKPEGSNLDAWIEAIQRGEPPWIAYKHLVYSPPITPEARRPRTITDSQGRFRFEGIEAERVVLLALKGPTIAYTEVRLVTRRIEPMSARGFASRHGAGSETIYGTEFTYTSSPGRPVEGVVRDAQTKLPMANVEVQSDSFARSTFGGIRDLKTTTDGKGRFHLVGLPKGPGNSLLVVPNDEQPYFMHDVTVPDPPGMAPVSVEVDLHRGIWIEGKVTDQEAGKPVEGIWLHYLPFLENTFAQATPEFGSGRGVHGTSFQDRYKTKADGSYRLVGLPGRAIVGAVSFLKTPYLRGAGSESIKGMDEHANFPTYYNPVPACRYFPTSMKEINPPAGLAVVKVDLELKSGAKVRVRVTDSDGKPVSGVLAAGRAARDRRDTEAQKEAEFEVICMGADEKRLVLVTQDERQLGMAFHVKAGDDKNGPVTIALEPLATLTGRVLDPDGNPVSGATVRTDPAPWTPGGFNLSLGQVASGRDGHFAVPKVPPGCKYNLAVESGNEPRNRRVKFYRDAAVRPGETSTLGDIQLAND